MFFNNDIKMIRENNNKKNIKNMIRNFAKILQSENADCIESFSHYNG